MRRNALLLLLLSSFALSAQVQEEFTDGDFTNNPAWVGDVNHFQINTKKELQLNAPAVAGKSQLTTSNSFAVDCSWQLDAKLNFNPSDQNLAKFYLVSSTNQLTGSLNGYYLLIGGSKDQVSLYRQDGLTAKLLISGASILTGSTNNAVTIKVDRTVQGEWILYTKLTASGGSFMEEGRVIDQTFLSTTCIGIQCIYTQSRNKLFYFDNISVRPLTEVVQPPIDVTPPTVNQFVYTSNNQFTVSFTEKVTIDQLQLTVSAHTIQKTTLNSDQTSITVQVAATFSHNQSYTISLTGVRDLAGNTMSPYSEKHTYVGQSALKNSYGAVVFSELMINPKEAKGLPEAEYIELFNQTDQPIELANWKLFYGEKPYAIPAYTLQSKSYVILCVLKDESLFDASINRLPLTSFPQLLNTGKLIWLEDQQDQLIDWFEYSDKLYSELSHKNGGISLEARDLSNLSNSALNWGSSTHQSGGTPARVNSILASNPDNVIPKVTAYLAPPDSIILSFNKPMLYESINKFESYLYKGSKDIVSLGVQYPQAMQVFLLLNEPLASNEVFELELSGVTDVSLKAIDEKTTLQLMQTSPAESMDVVINEILFNPLQDGVDYVELYNRSSKQIDLSTLYLSSYKSDHSMNTPIRLSTMPLALPPASYLVITTNKEVVCSQYSCSEQALYATPTTLPVFANTSGSVLLVNKEQQLIDAFEYSEKMHHPLVKEYKGVSLERKSIHAPTQDASNWSSASQTSGGGTPGFVNSTASNSGNPDELLNDGFSLVHSSFSPNGDQFNDELTLQYTLSEADFIANITIYDIQGREIVKLASQAQLSAHGSFVWRGEDAGNNRCSTGVYLIYIELFNQTGVSKKIKIPCVLGW